MQPEGGAICGAGGLELGWELLSYLLDGIHMHFLNASGSGCMWRVMVFFYYPTAFIIQIFFFFLKPLFLYF